MRRLRILPTSALIALVLLSMALPAPRASACGRDGPYLNPAAKNREATLGDFARGKIGLLSPSWRRTYLIASYRWFQGAAIGVSEQRALVEEWEGRPRVYRDAANGWSVARNQVAVTQVRAPQSHRQGSAHSHFLNCTDGAFDTASATLASRVRARGGESAHLKEWIAGQDVVFANCGGGTHVPSEPGEGAPEWLQKDRSYQIAAAHFYAGNFAAAVKGFDAIAADASSPWQPLAAYVASRALVRQASLGTGNRSALQREAIARLGRITGDASLATMHNASRNLLDLVRYRLEPAAQLGRLAEQIERNDTHGRLATMARDLSHGIGDLKAKERSALRQHSDLTDWLLALRGDGVQGYERARTVFAKKGSQAWLVAALTLATPTSPGLGLLLTGADTIKPDSPAFASTRFHQIRLLAAAGKHGRAKKLLAEAMRQPMAGATRNAFSALGLAMATSLKEWQRYALREESDANVLHADARASMRSSFSLAMLERTARMPGLRTETIREILMAGFVRAIVLGEASFARRFARALKPLAPEMATGLGLFLHSKAKHRPGIGALVVLRNESRFGEPSYRESLSGYEQSCKPMLFCSTSDPSLTSIVEVPGIGSGFGRPGQHLRAQRLGTRLDGLGRQVQRFARTSPNHAQVPEALHFFVRASRRASIHATATGLTGDLSKASFKLLQSKYKGTEWARNTRYWYR
ncbi:MAG: hypothetical protein GY811_22920 [Myxococcales bacterium]|nr:hypothetical protein [Myxococcales bacterium]